jgi:hypothetical protein
MSVDEAYGNRKERRACEYEVQLTPERYEE